jgi:two-component system, OmpR family, response regulator
MTVQAIKLLLVEDSSVLGERIAELVAGIPQIELVAVVDSELAAQSELRKRQIHLVVLDLHLKQGTGFGLLRWMSLLNYKPQIIVLTNHDSAEYEQSALTLGATLFLDKAQDFPRLPEILADLVAATPTEGTLVRG